MEGSDTPPGAARRPRPSASGILAPLASALGQCLCIVLAGLLCRQWGLFSSTDAQGLSAFVGRCSLPALLFLAMVNLDIETMDWPIFYTLASTKIAVFVGTVVCCRLALSDGKRRAILDEPIGLVRDSSIRSTLSGSTAADDCDECELNAAAARARPRRRARGCAAPGCTPSSPRSRTILRSGCRSSARCGGRASCR